MPTVIRKNGFEIVIYPDDHLPPHVHVFKSGEEIKISLGNSDTRPVLIEAWMSKKNAKKALELVMENQENLIIAWRKIHG